MPNQPASSPSTTVFFAFSVPAVFLAISSIGTAITCGGCHARQRDGCRARRPSCLVDHDRVAADRQLGAELEEVLPVQGHGDVERAAGVENRRRVEIRTRQEDSPPRIWEPKLLVMMAW